MKAERLTGAGKIFLEHARLALSTADAAVLAGRRANRGELGRLSIAYVHSAMLEPELPSLLKRFNEASPDVQIDLRDISVQEQVNALADESIDLAFIRLPCGALPRTINLTPVSRTPLDAVVPLDHKSAKSKKFNLRELAADRFIFVNDPPGVGLGHRAYELCHEAGITPPATLRTSDAISVLRLISAGMGVGIVPRTLKPYSAGDCVFKPLPMANCYSEIAIATRAFDQSASVRMLLRLVREK